MQFLFLLLKWYFTLTGQGQSLVPVFASSTGGLISWRFFATIYVHGIKIVRLLKYFHFMTNLLLHLWFVRQIQRLKTNVWVHSSHGNMFSQTSSRVLAFLVKHSISFHPRFFVWKNIYLQSLVEILNQISLIFSLDYWLSAKLSAVSACDLMLFWFTRRSSGDLRCHYSVPNKGCFLRHLGSIQYTHISFCWAVCRKMPYRALNDFELLFYQYLKYPMCLSEVEKRKIMYTLYFCFQALRIHQAKRALLCCPRDNGS